MEALVILFVLVIIGLFIVLPIIALVKASIAQKQAEDANRLTASLQQRLSQLESQMASPAPRSQPTAAVPPVAAPSETAAAAVELTQPSRPAVSPPLPPLIIPPAAEPVLVAPTRASTDQTAARRTAEIFSVSPVSQSSAPAVPSKAAVNWEQFVGAKLFAWVAGLALFLGVAFFLKWSFDKGFITPPIRIVMGLATGLGLLAAGLRLPQARHAALVQSLTSAGVLILYADIFAAGSFYHYLGNAAAFALMSLITVVAFLLALRLNSQVVAALGLLGGFLTPPLLSTGVDQPFGLFGYIALLDAGLLAVALRQRWHYFASLSAVATVIMQWGWVHKFFAVEKIHIALAVFLVFAVLFLAAFLLAHHRKQITGTLTAAACLMPLSAMVFAFYIFVRPYSSLAAQPGLMFGFVFLADAAWLAVTGWRTELRSWQAAAGGVVFLLIGLWTVDHLNPGLLHAALAVYLAFGILHTIYPVVVERLRPSANPSAWAQVFVVLALLLTMVPMFKLDQVPLIVWPVILALDLVAIVIALLSASVLLILSVLVMTALATAVWICTTAAHAAGLPESLVVIGGFALVFFAVGVVIARKISLSPEGAGAAWPATRGWQLAQLTPEQVRALIPAMSALLPFLLLAMLLMRLRLNDPTPVFGLAALMFMLLLVAMRCYAADWVGVAGLAGLGLVESVWQFNRFQVETAHISVTWYVGFYVALAVFPFLFQRQMQNRLAPWLMAALAGPVQFFWVYRAMTAAFPNAYMGLVPAAFAVPTLLAIVRLIQTVPPASPQRNRLLALFGGVGLFFITLIFPIQFEKQWITLGWALEGAALLWLLHRVPQVGLKYAGVALLVVAFTRLALNPAVLHYYPRAATPIWNWYLYAYGIVTLCLFAGAKLLAPPRHQIWRLNVPPVLAGLGTVLAFLLLNIEIADYYSTGSTITFQFSGHFGRDMTYSLAWAVFAFILLVAGLGGRIAGWRYAGLGLLTVTLVKLFLHDLWNLGGLYRIGSLIGLALVLIPVSFIYQRFFTPEAQKKPAASDPPQQPSNLPPV